MVEIEPDLEMYEEVESEKCEMDGLALFSNFRLCPSLLFLARIKNSSEELGG